MIRVGVCGGGGRMGSEACRAVEGASGLELVASIGSSGRVSSFVEAGADVVVDFTVASAARENVPALAAAGVHAVVGTSGLTSDDVAALREAFISSHCLVASNFAVGAVLMMRFAELAARFFETAEVIEYHHDRKIDAPSATALQTARAMAGASGDWAADPTADLRLPGARGGRAAGGIPVHSVRLQGLLARQEVHLGGPGETLAIRHDTADRHAFMPGVLLAVRHVAVSPPGLTSGLERIMGL